MGTTSSSILGRAGWVFAGLQKFLQETETIAAPLVVLDSHHDFVGIHLFQPV